MKNNLMFGVILYMVAFFLLALIVSLPSWVTGMGRTMLLFLDLILMISAAFMFFSDSD